MKSKKSVLALTAFLILGGAAITGAQPTTNTNSNTGTPSMSPTPPGSTLPAGTPSATPQSDVTPFGAPSLTPATSTTVSPNGMNPTTPTGEATEKDRRFAVKAAEGGLAEVELASLALKQSQNSQVRDFAQRMVKDHSAMNTDLMRLATARGIVLPSRMNAKDQASYNFLARRTGSRFDEPYLRQQVRAHQEAAELFQQASTESNDPALGQFFTMHRGHITQHLETVRILAKDPE